MKYLEELLLTIAALILGLIIGKQASRLISKTGLPIASGDPVKRPV